jgi:hypothetical protein
MDTFFFLMFAFLFTMVGGLIGALFVGPCEYSGRAALTRQFAIATVVAVMIPALPAAIWGVGIFTDRFDGPMVTAALGGIAMGTFIGALLCRVFIPQSTLAYLREVPKIAPFGLKTFKLLDLDEDGVVSAGDLGHAKEQVGAFSAEEIEIIDFMRNHIGSIGHGVGSYTTYNATTKTTSSTTVCVISPRDLESFEARVNEKYSAWLPELRHAS